jgi:hypothetical protein
VLAGHRVGDKNRLGTDQATAIEGAGFVGKIQNLMGLDRIIFTPVAQVDAVKTGSLIRVHVGRAQVENIGFNLGEAQ